MLKRYILAILVIGIVSVIVVPIRRGFIAGKSDMMSDSDDITVSYEQQLITDPVLRQQVEDFSSPRNILELFQRHEEQLQIFANECYENRKKKDRFFVEYINDNLYYFSTADDIDEAHLTEDEAIKSGTYDDITTFMDYAINSGLVFKDWMITIETPNPVDADEFWEKRNNNYGALLFITIYKGEGLEITFLYAPYEDVDYSYEYYGVAYDIPNPMGGSKIVRINSHWYYQYIVSKQSDIWCPNPKTLGFSVIE